MNKYIVIIFLSFATYNVNAETYILSDNACGQSGLSYTYSDSVVNNTKFESNTQDENEEKEVIINYDSNLYLTDEIKKGISIPYVEQIHCEVA